MYRRIIEEFANSNSNQIIGKKDFSKEIIDLFTDFFENKHQLEIYSNDYLIQDYINYKRNNLHIYKSSLLAVYSLFSEAKSKCAEKTYAGVANFQPVSVEIGNKHWSMLKLQNNLDELDDHEYVFECFNLIEYICENLLKYLFALMVYLNRVSNEKDPDFKSISRLKFGNLVNELEQSGKLNPVISILSSDVSISQWRNIACHKSYQYVDKKIYCQYGKNLEKNKTIDTKEELLHTAKLLYTIAQVLLLPAKFFLYDNIESIRNKMTNLSIVSINFRKEDWQLIYVTELLANGFLVTDINDTDELQITVEDTQEDKDYDRIMLIPIAAYKAWVLTGEKTVKIIYIQRNKKPYISITLTEDVCKKVSNYEKDFSYIAEKMIVEKY